jgi:hypothetical protein
MGVLARGRHAVAVEGREQLPPTREPSELVRPAFLEYQVGPSRHVTHGTGHEDLAGARLADDAGPRVDRDPPDLAAVSDAFAGVESSSNLQSELSERGRDGGGAQDGRCRRVEGREEAVAGIVDLGPTPSIEEFADPPVVGPQERRSRTRPWWALRSRDHRRSPSVAARRVDPTRSVKSSVTRTRR